MTGGGAKNSKRFGVLSARKSSKDFDSVGPEIIQGFGASDRKRSGACFWNSDVGNRNGFGV